MKLGSEPQQLLLRSGLQYTLAPSVRISAGYGYIATAPYGSLPSATPMREQRSWQQLLLTHRAGSARVSHRYRLEQRWIRLLLSSSGETAGALGPTTYQNRLRHLSRAQVNLGTLTYHTRLCWALSGMRCSCHSAGRPRRLPLRRIALRSASAFPFRALSAWSWPISTFTMRLRHAAPMRSITHSGCRGTTRVWRHDNAEQLRAIPSTNQGNARFPAYALAICTTRARAAVNPSASAGDNAKSASVNNVYLTVPPPISLPKAETRSSRTL